MARVEFYHAVKSRSVRGKQPPPPRNPAEPQGVSGDTEAPVPQGVAPPDVEEDAYMSTSSVDTDELLAPSPLDVQAIPLPTVREVDETALLDGKEGTAVVAAGGKDKVTVKRSNKPAAGGKSEGKEAKAVDIRKFCMSTGTAPKGANASAGRGKTLPPS